MTQVLYTRHVLAVLNLDEATRYFVEVLCFNKDPVDVEGWSFLSFGEFLVMLGACPDDVSAAETKNHSFFAHVMVSDVEGLYVKYKENGALFASHLADKPWGHKEFCVRTPDGHRIVFAEELD